MKTITLVCIFVNFCALMINLAYLKPVADLEANTKVHVQSGHKKTSARPRRGILDMDAVNPAVLHTDDGTKESKNDELPDSLIEDDTSVFARSDSVAEYSRHNKIRDTQDPLHGKQGPDKSAPAHGWGKDDALIQGELSSDEQVECYKQQNIDPPIDIGPLREPIKTILKLKDQRPFSDAFDNKERMLSRPIITKEKGTKRQRNKDDDDIITSLYSAPESRHKLSRHKGMNTKVRNYNLLDHFSEPSVYKPVGVRPEFPVYDEDIDFHPDPLQGILEEKYWLDPQEQEAVIRKYIDLSSNMQLQRVEKRKREAQKDYVPKSVDSKEAFKEAVDKECPCREVAACKDCSRGKWRKSHNRSEADEVVPLYVTYEKRKLLSINSHDDEESDGTAASEKGGAFLEGNKGYNFQEDQSEKELSENYEILDGSDIEESQVEEVPSFTSNYFGRKLMSLEDDGNTEENYGEDEDSEVTEYKSSNGVQSYESRPINLKTECSDEYENLIQKLINRRSIRFGDSFMIGGKKPNEKHYVNPIVLNKSNNSLYEFKLETENIGTENPNVADEFLQMQKPFLDNPQNIAKYYVPDKLGNLLQKAIKQPKQSQKNKSSTLDPDLEFEILQNKTFLNVSIAMNDINISVTTETVEEVKKNKRQEQPVLLRVKGRRSYPLLQHPNGKTLQGAEGLGNLYRQDGNSTQSANISAEQLGNTNVPQSANTSAAITANISAPGNITFVDNNSTTNASTNSINETTVMTTTELNETTEFFTTPKSKKKIEDDDEDTFDAEIANDIVETVIAESQSGSVVGHNLGLCRRNDSLSKYAKVSPESEQLLKRVTQCILEHIRERLEGQSCTLLDDELLQFLKWMVLSGESYKDYLARLRPELMEFKSEVHEEGSAPTSIKNTEAQATTVPEMPVIKIP